MARAVRDAREAREFVTYYVTKVRARARAGDAGVCHVLRDKVRARACAGDVVVCHVIRDKRRARARAGAGDVGVCHVIRDKGRAREAGQAREFVTYYVTKGLRGEGGEKRALLGDERVP